MDKIFRQSLLFDFYGELLTDHQKAVFSSVVNDDMSYSEIAEENGVSRQGVFDLVKRCNKILEDYEAKLKLVERFLRAQESIEAIRGAAADLRHAKNKDERDAHIGRIEGLADSILEDF